MGLAENPEKRTMAVSSGNRSLYIDAVAKLRRSKMFIVVDDPLDQ